MGVIGPRQVALPAIGRQIASCAASNDRRVHPAIALTVLRRELVAGARAAIFGNAALALPKSWPSVARDRTRV